MCSPDILTGASLMIICVWVFYKKNVLLCTYDYAMGKIIGEKNVKKRQSKDATRKIIKLEKTTFHFIFGKRNQMTYFSAQKFKLSKLCWFISFIWLEASG